MCKDKLGDCGCGCKKCGGKSESKAVSKKTSSLPVVKPMVSSGYSKYSDDTYTPTVSKEFTKKDDPSNDVIIPDVEVAQAEVTTKPGNGGVVAAGISLAFLFLVAALADRKEKKSS